MCFYEDDEIVGTVALTGSSSQVATLALAAVPSVSWPQDLPQCRGRWALPSLWLHIPGRLHKTHWHRSWICSLVLPKTQNRKGNHVTEMRLSRNEPMVVINFQSWASVWSHGSWYWMVLNSQNLSQAARTKQPFRDYSISGQATSESLKLFQELFSCMFPFF